MKGSNVVEREVDSFGKEVRNGRTKKRRWKKEVELRDGGGEPERDGRQAVGLSGGRGAPARLLGDLNQWAVASRRVRTWVG